MNTITQSFLFGRDEHRAFQFLLFAGIICLAITAVITIRAVAGLSFNWYAEDLRAMFLYGIGALALAGAIPNAYLNDDLVVSMLIILAIALGYGLATIILMNVNQFVTDSPPALLFLYFAGGAIVIGIIAFFFGIGIRGIIEYDNI
jgi:hypothetical protein